MRIARRIIISLAALGVAALVTCGLWFSHEGYQAYIVHTGSMTGTYNSGDLVIDRPVRGPLHVGESITFYHSGLSSDVVTHRIVGLNRGTIQTKGDANRTPDAWDIRHNQVRGIVTASLPKVGYVVYYLKQRAGVASVMTATLAMVLLWTIFFPSALGAAVSEDMPNIAAPEAVGLVKLRGRARSARNTADAVETLRTNGLATIS
jgi:signal peptidase